MTLRALLLGTAAWLIVPGHAAAQTYTFGVWQQQLGANGNPGGDAPALTVNNANPIVLNPSGATNGAGIWAADQGGAGSSGGAGGSSDGLFLTNTGAISVTATGPVGFAGIQGYSIGGNGSNGGPGSGGGAGGASGQIQMSNTASINVDWTWQNVGSANSGVYGIQAQSQGGQGQWNKASAGGAGGDAGAVSLVYSGQTILTATGTPPSSQGFNTAAGILLAGYGGAGGEGPADGNSNQPGGNGGSVNGFNLQMGKGGVKTVGNQMPGVLIAGTGGAGAFSGCQLQDCDPQESGAHNNGGNGGSILPSPNAPAALVGSLSDTGIVTVGTDSPGMAVALQGGSGGAGGTQTSFDHADGGAGGNGGSISLAGIDLQTVDVNTTGGTSPGIVVASLGGNAGNAGNANGTIGSAFGGNGGAGGSGGDVNVNLLYSSIRTVGANSPGIILRSEGGIGGNGGSGGAGIGAAGGGAGGSGGGAGNLSVSLDSNSAITTQGNNSYGIVLQSFSGAGGDGSGETGDAGNGGNGGNGGAAGNLSVANAGSITTVGVQASGILAQTMAGAGGGGGSAFGVFRDAGGTGASGGSVGGVVVSHSGAISTSGDAAKGILAQSIGGSGGVGGQASGGFYTVGGSASNDPFQIGGGDITVSLTGLGQVATTGDSAFGILGQSIGGGGGDGGGGAGLKVTVGGSGGAGGNGGMVLATLGGKSQVTTTGNMATAVAMQSIGGGGGNAGNSSSTGLFAAVALGSTGGKGGAGGTASITTNGATITTAGSKSTGLLVQSIGGGGGTGGNALAGSIGAGLSATVALGGSAGSGNSGGTASALVVGGLISTGQTDFLVNGGAMTGGLCRDVQCNAMPVDNFGVVVQSIGGGGGLGGTGLAESVAIAIPVTPSGSQIGVAAAATVGGSGGSGASGGAAQFGLSNGGSIITSGQGSTGALVQSIGGGGGSGGDSSAMSMVVGYGQTVPEEGASSLGATATFTMGGSGGAAGDGGQVLVALGGTIVNGAPQQDAAGSAATSIVTYGDFSNGITAHSIGGGGGNAGIGSGNTQSVGTGSTISGSIGLGSSGSGGGNGGAVTVSLFAGNGITTWGSGSMGIAAQSIGGGGGTTQGGSSNLGKTFSAGKLTYEPDLKFGFGSTSTNGGDGGAVTVNVAAPIVTHGGDATGVVAQSIGGGGGIGGSAGSDASADNPIIRVLQSRQGASNIKNTLKDGKVAVEGTLSIQAGGTGGGGGNGGTVNVNLSNAITTSGDWANGVIAHSIGGGGGKGGTAVATGSGGVPEATVNIDSAMGGQGGGGGAGGAVTVSLNQGSTAISTAGYAAAGLIAQSVGGGGGIGADGSDSATGSISLGAGTDGGGGAGGAGSAVLLQYSNTKGSRIATTGTAADGIVLQSIGGGGGIGGAGTSLFVSSFTLPGKTLNVSAGGGQAANGDGGAVTLQAQTSTNNPLDIKTTGNYAFGLLAQSIGGGGGLITVQPSAQTVTKTIGSDAAGGAGGAVNVIGNNLNVTTTGVLAHGIVAQSIGGGGGVIRVADPTIGSPSLSTNWTGTQSKAGAGGGGSVTVDVDNGGTLKIGGAGAVGILAQSIGGGGGLVLDGNALFAGKTSTGSGGAGGPVAVNILDGSTVSATGAQGIGVFAQSAGAGGGGTSTITITGRTDGSGAVSKFAAVNGGVGTQATPDQPGASAVQIDGPGGGTVTLQAAQVSSGLGANGTAIVATGGVSVAVNVLTDASLTGSVYAGGAGQVQVGSSATFHAGPAVVAGLVENRGLVNVGGAGAVGATTLTGSYRQTSSGTLAVDVDALSARRADLLTITGNADIAGAIVPTATRLLPGTYPILSAGSLSSQASAPSSLLFDWRMSNDGKTVSLTPNARFAPAGVALARNEGSLAGHLNTAWSNSDAFFAPFFGYLSQMGGGSGSSYISTLRSLSPEAAHAQATSLLASSGTVLGAALSCPVFVDAGTQLGEDECAWAKVTGGWANQGQTRDTQGFRVSEAMYRLGGQKELAPGWYLGGSFGAGQSWSTANNGSSGRGFSVDGSVSLKHVAGPWLLAGSLAVAHGSYDNSRFVLLPGFGAGTGVFDSDSSMTFVAGRLRAGYEFAFPSWYIRPQVDLDLVYANAPGYREQGIGSYALDVQGSHHTSVIVSPTVEIGGRFTLDDAVLRPFLSAGVSFNSNDARVVKSRFVGAALQDGTFQTYLNSPAVVGNVTAGLTFYAANGFEAKAEYALSAGESFLVQRGSLRFAYHF
ncbi:autotransporter outer membrane beta-barrel domain-containing protein [Chelatococcus reniformis]|uniref:autotransporter outer membrane beta-barrel domain-containing protein n=1 Tax=Chelatococcus reniformis TaxID=1494448 RepID=UPI00166F3B3E|nr:autotransporter outer membrane beta-barrel domain-containing protein [Chelatococcus reniformis]